MLGSQLPKPTYPLLSSLTACQLGMHGGLSSLLGLQSLPQQQGLGSSQWLNTHSAWAQEECGARSRVFWGTGAHTAPLFPVASFLSSWDQMVNGNERPVGGSGEAAVGGAAGMAPTGRGEQGTVLSPHGINSFRSESLPCLTSPGLSMQRQSPVRLSSGHCRSPEGCRSPVPGRQQCCPDDRQSGCSHLCSRVWHGQEGELWPLAPPQEPCLLQPTRQGHPLAAH